MEKKLIKFNQANHDNELRNAQTDLKAYNGLLKDILPFASIAGITLDKAAITGLLKKPKEFAFDTLVGNAPLTIAGVTVSKNKAMDLIEMPDAWVKIINLVDAFNQERNKIPVRNPYQQTPDVRHIGLDSFELVKNEFILSGDYIEQLKQTHSVFTSNENQNAALKHITDLHTTLMALKKMGIPVGAFMTLEKFGYSQSSGGLSGGIVELCFNPALVVSQVK